MVIDHIHLYTQIPTKRTRQCCTRRAYANGSSLLLLFFSCFSLFVFISTVIFFTKQLFMLYPSKFFLLSPVYPKCLRHTSYFSIFKGSGIHEEASLTSASSICSRYRILQHISSLLPSFINAFECMASSSRSPVPMF